MEGKGRHRGGGLRERFGKKRKEDIEKEEERDLEKDKAGERKT